jgi:D-tyrosyl-tRNA(Tyr) deacylase
LAPRLVDQAMKVLLQRVSSAFVCVQGKNVGAIGQGLLIFVGFEKGDIEQSALRMAERVLHYRVFPDIEGKTNASVFDISGELLVVSQFTLAADTRKGRRPSFDPSLEPRKAEKLLQILCKALRVSGLKVSEGVFGAAMEVSLVNQGPATYWLEAKKSAPSA